MAAMPTLLAWVVSAAMAAASPATAPGTATRRPADPPWDESEAIADYAARIGVAPEVTVDLGQGVTLPMTLAAAGAFMMGSRDSAEETATSSGAELRGVGANTK